MRKALNIIRLVAIFVGTLILAYLIALVALGVVFDDYIDTEGAQALAGTIAPVVALLAAVLVTVDKAKGRK